MGLKIKKMQSVLYIVIVLSCSYMMYLCGVCSGVYLFQYSNCDTYEIQGSFRDFKWF